MCGKPTTSYALSCPACHGARNAHLRQVGNLLDTHFHSKFRSLAGLTLLGPLLHASLKCCLCRMEAPEWHLLRSSLELAVGLRSRLTGASKCMPMLSRPVASPRGGGHVVVSRIHTRCERTTATAAGLTGRSARHRFPDNQAVSAERYAEIPKAEALQVLYCRVHVIRLFAAEIPAEV